MLSEVVVSDSPGCTNFTNTAEPSNSSNSLYAVLLHKSMYPSMSVFYSTGKELISLLYQVSLVLPMMTAMFSLDGEAL